MGGAGRPQAEIVMAENPTRMVKLAVREFQASVGMAAVKNIKR